MSTKTKFNKAELILFCIIIVISLFLPCVLLKDMIKLAQKPESAGQFLYSYAYGGYAKKFLNMNLIALSTYLAIVIFLIIKKKLLFSIPITATAVLGCFSLFGLLIVSVKEKKSMASYTTDINNYGYYDELIEEEIKLIEPLLPNKENITKYEYLLTDIRGIWKKYIDATIYIEVYYEKSIEKELINNEEYQLVMDINDDNFKDYDVYSRSLDDLGEGKQYFNSLYILVSKDKSKIYYGLVSNGVDIIKKYENNFYIFGFISGDRDNPFHEYTEDK